MEVYDILDLETFIRDQPGSPAFQVLVSRCCAELGTDAMFNLAGSESIKLETQVVVPDSRVERLDTFAWGDL